jgi:histidinol dehydrogenase
VQPILEAVKTGGAQAVLGFGEQFDKVRPASLRVPSSVIEQSLRELDQAVRLALEEAIRRVRQVHQAQVPREHCVDLAAGATVRQRWVPVRRAGLYVPGGLVVYPSSVVMNAVPAEAAGVEQLVVASPPQHQCGGWPHPTILAACALLGIDEVYAAGGAQAIALLAYGSSSPLDNPADLSHSPLIDPVDVITGPGNRWVQAAKRLVQGQVGIDAEAGPTEIAIFADSTANPEYLAADLISQAEHDPLAASVLVTPLSQLAEAVNTALNRRIPATKHCQRVATALAGQQSGIVLVDDIAQGLAVVNAYGAEHLEIHTSNAAQLANQVRNAGAIFVGPHTPVPLGDYIAGSNHVLPTAGTARFASGLTVLPFLRAIAVIEYDSLALAEVSDQAQAIALAEDLPAHAQSLAARAADSSSS